MKSKCSYLRLAGFSTAPVQQLHHRKFVEFGQDMSRRSWSYRISTKDSADCKLVRWKKGCSRQQVNSTRQNKQNPENRQTQETCVAFILLYFVKGFNLTQQHASQQQKRIGQMMLFRVLQLIRQDFETGVAPWRVSFCGGGQDTTSFLTGLWADEPDMAWWQKTHSEHVSTNDFCLQVSKILLCRTFLCNKDSGLRRHSRLILSATAGTPAGVNVAQQRLLCARTCQPGL